MSEVGPRLLDEVCSTAAAGGCVGGLRFSMSIRRRPVALSVAVSVAVSVAIAVLVPVGIVVARSCAVMAAAGTH
jgi:hypothetical protein